MQTIIKDKTILRIENIIGRKWVRGGDRAINEALTKLGAPEVEGIS